MLAPLPRVRSWSHVIGYLAPLGRRLDVGTEAHAGNEAPGFRRL